ncbi:DNA-directed RNA polymerase I subunit RPA49 [Apiospora arundinis]|uniref:RNA polymerase I associated factor A49-like protein n=1 Tax=Apiospora arundinis TaxID=335852 RepID=A0ABR2JAQ5_9PEZI
MGSKRKIEDASSGRNKTKKPRQAAPQPQTVKIASVRTARECAPAIASTPGLCVPSSLNFQAYTKPAPTQKKSKKAALPELLLHASTDRVDYTAKEDGDGGVATHLKHYIGVFDPTTGKLDVIEAKKMTVRGVPRAQKAPEDKSAEAYQTMTEQRNTLGMEFGTKKAKKAIASITENAIGPAKSNVEGATKLDSSSLAIMDSMSEAARSVASRDQLQATADQAKPIPPGHFDATEIQDVYLPEELIGADLLSSIPIKDWQDIAKKQSPLTSPNKYVTENFWEIARSLHPVRDLRILRYLNCLLTIVKNLRKGKERGSFKLPDRKKLQELLDPAPVQLIDSIRRKFSEGGDVRKFHMDLVKTYCCALVSILHNYEFDTESLRYDLQLTEKEFAQYYRTIGGKVLVRAGPKDGPKGVKTQIAKLALPLEFPQMRFARRR